MTVRLWVIRRSGYGCGSMPHAFQVTTEADAVRTMLDGDVLVREMSIEWVDEQRVTTVRVPKAVERENTASVDPNGGMDAPTD